MTPSRPAPVIVIDTARIIDWPTFHAVFAEACGFPSFYGANRDAWIDCMTSLDDVDAGMTTVPCERGQMVTLQLGDIAGFAARCPRQFRALLEDSAFVNWRRLERGEGAVLALAFVGR